MTDRSFIDWFRHAAPYIHAHRGRTFVVAFGGEAVADPEFHRLVNDLALLNSLGVRLVIVHGTRPQIEAALKVLGIESEFADGLRVTRPEALPCVKAAVGTARVEIEAQLTMDRPNSPMSGARVRVATGNVITARPVGVRNGVDYWYTGAVRRVDADAIRERLDAGSVVLISNLGYSWTGEVFNLGVHDVAQQVAESLQADKLVCLTEGAGLQDASGTLLREETPEGILSFLDDNGALQQDCRRWARAAAAACAGGVARAHVISRAADGGLLQELFTRDGVGTLVTRERYEGMRTASPLDLADIVALIRPLEARGVLVPRSRERLERELEHFVVAERDTAVVACAALYPLGEDAGEVSCFAVHPEYRKGGQGEALLAFLERRAVKAGMKRLFVLTTQTAHWFHERGYEPAEVDALPDERRSLYNASRGSKIFVKDLYPQAPPW